jgi:hypothetical protein
MIGQQPQQKNAAEFAGRTRLRRRQPFVRINREHLADEIQKIRVGRTQASGQRSFFGPGSNVSIAMMRKSTQHNMPKGNNASDRHKSRRLT